MEIRLMGLYLMVILEEIQDIIIAPMAQIFVLFLHLPLQKKKKSK